MQSFEVSIIERYDREEYLQLGWVEVNKETIKYVIRLQVIVSNSFYGSKGLAVNFESGDPIIRFLSFNPWFSVFLYLFYVLWFE